jgi:hypothetical protein
MGEIRTLSARHLLDPDPRIGWTSPNWDRFTIENGAPELAADSPFPPLAYAVCPDCKTAAEGTPVEPLG